MPLVTYNGVAIAKATGARGSSGEVIDPILTENAANSSWMQGVPNSTAVFGHSGVFVQDMSYTEPSYTSSYTGLVHPNAYARLGHMMWGAGVHGTTGTTAQTWTWATTGAPWELVAFERRSTAAGSTFVLQKAYMTQFQLMMDRINSKVKTMFSIQGSDLLREQTNPTITVPDTSKALTFGTLSGKVSTFTFTKSGGTADDLLDRCTMINFTSNRSVTARKSPVNAFPNADLPDPAGYVTESITFTNQDPSVLTPADVDYGYATGGSVSGAVSTPVEGTFELELLGAMTTGDATVPFTFNIAGDCTFTGSTDGAHVFSGTLILNSFPTRYFWNDVASVARPT